MRPCRLPGIIEAHTVILLLVRTAGRHRRLRTVYQHQLRRCASSSTMDCGWFGVHIGGEVAAVSLCHRESVGRPLSRGGDFRASVRRTAVVNRSRHATASSGGLQAVGPSGTPVISGMRISRSDLSRCWQYSASFLLTRIAFSHRWHSFAATAAIADP